MEPNDGKGEGDAEGVNGDGDGKREEGIGVDDVIVGIGIGAEGPPRGEIRELLPDEAGGLIESEEVETTGDFLGVRG
jgi:hypothetical protein